MEVMDENEEDWVLLLAENVYIESDEEDLAAGVAKLDETKSSSLSRFTPEPGDVISWFYFFLAFYDITTQLIAKFHHNLTRINNIHAYWWCD